jgi:2-amino-4-hydroxy-6-hydroxymethyldihydropteridine diphosphokinase
MPRESLARACRELDSAGVKVVACSSLYITAPVGGGRQPPYLNAVLKVQTDIPPARLLRLLKQLERRAGRRSTPPMQARPLDIDILDYGGRHLNWRPRRRERGRLILPHPHLAERAFVLVPLLELAPKWSHPVLGRRAKALLVRGGPTSTRGIRRALDFRPCACDKAPR